MIRAWPHPQATPGCKIMAHRRYAILHHKLPDGEHWDLLLEQDDVLATWQLADEPLGPVALPIAALRVFDHRKKYLTYEGPISGGRGSVTRYDGGDLRILETGRERWLFDLSGPRFSGRFCLVRVAGSPPDHWLFTAG